RKIRKVRRGRALSVDARDDVVEADAGLETLELDVRIVGVHYQAAHPGGLEDKADRLRARGCRLEIGVVAVLAVEGHAGVVVAEYTLNHRGADLSRVRRPELREQIRSQERLGIVAAEGELLVEGLPPEAELRHVG